MTLKSTYGWLLPSPSWARYEIPLSLISRSAEKAILKKWKIEKPCFILSRVIFFLIKESHLCIIQNINTCPKDPSCTIVSNELNKASLMKSSKSSGYTISNKEAITCSNVSVYKKWSPNLWIKQYSSNKFCGFIFKIKIVINCKFEYGKLNMAHRWQICTEPISNGNNDLGVLPLHNHTEVTTTL